MQKPKYTKQEEVSHYLSHIIGLIIALFIGFYTLTITKTTLEFFSILFFISTMFTMYLTSIIYHYQSNVEKKKFWRKLDHAAIFLFILGTYAPYCLVGLQTLSAIILFNFLVILTICGVVFKIFFTGKFKLISTLIFLAMGWSCIFILPQIIGILSFNQLLFLILGGVFYTIGAIFYALGKFKYHHLIWHIFIILAATSHSISILLLIIN